MADAPRILVIEDDPAIAGSVVRGLRREGFLVELATDGATGLEKATTGAFALVVLDLMLPETDGFAILEACRTRVSAPVVVMTARGGLDDRLRVFQLGAADCVIKPFFLEELVARVRARLRLPAADTTRLVRHGPLELDPDARLARVDGVDIDLTVHEYNVLACLVDRAGRPTSRATLVAAALAADGSTEERTVDSHVARIRKKLGEAGGMIETVRHLGYRFRPPA